MLSFRPLIPADQTALWHWLHIALWDPPPAPLRPIEVLAHPGVRIYAEDWGRSGDIGLVAVRDGQDAVGLASVDATTPQLGIGLLPAFQRQGIGKPLMQAALRAAWAQGHTQVALTVHPENPARRIYAACGFEEAGLRGSYHLMVARRP